MPLDPKEFEKVFVNHFESVAPEQFLDNFKEACLYLFDEDLDVNNNAIDRKEDRPEHVNKTDEKVQHYF